VFGRENEHLFLRHIVGFIPRTRFEEGEGEEDEDDESEDGEVKDDDDEGEPERERDSEAETEDIEVYTSSNCYENEGDVAEEDDIIEFTASV